MKNPITVSMLSLFLSFFSIMTTAQNQIIWQGGQPGQETTWNCPQNWTGNIVPTEDHHVIIKRNNSGHDSQPIIDSPTSVSSIEVLPNAVLTIAITGKLFIDGTFKYSDGITIVNGKIINNGRIRIINVDKKHLPQIDGKGEIIYKPQAYAMP